ncbi:MAG: hypothetical protein AAF211_05000, partial [Myxococcota bacterium]
MNVDWTTIVENLRAAGEWVLGLLNFTVFEQGETRITVLTIASLVLLGWLSLRISRAAQRGVARANQRLRGGVQLQES